MNPKIHGGKIMKPNLSKLKECWSSPFVAREKVGVFSGGILHPRTMANLDALGQGPKGRIKIAGKKIAYPVEELVDWMQDRCETA
jgi:hypothetical protein